MRFFLEQGLKLYMPAGKAANMGTIYHSQMETMALIKKARQDGRDSFTSKLLGEVKLSEIKSLSGLAEQIYQKHIETDLSGHEWDKKDLKTILKWFETTLRYNGGDLNPLKMEIVATEHKFELPFDYDWADIGDGKKFMVRGIMDLVAMKDGMLNLIDWKSGKMNDFYTGKDKDYEDLMNDIQLLTYYYAMRKLYPDHENIMINIFYVKAGGIFTLCFSDSDLTRVEEKFRIRFETIKNMKIPHQNKSWRCNKFCPFSKVSFPKEKQLIEFRDGKFQSVGTPMSICDQAEFTIRKQGIDFVEKTYKVEKKA